MHPLGKLIIGFIFLVLFASISLVFAENYDYYVNAVTGSDTSGDGRESNPWKTITYALSQVGGTEEDTATIHVAAGNYNVELGESFPLQMESYVSLSGDDEEKDQFL